MSEQRREALLNALEASEAGELEPVVEKEIETDELEGTNHISASESEKVPETPRDEKGRFVAKDEEINSNQQQASDDVVESQEQEEPSIPRPTTWKKEYLPIWDKLTSGQQLTREEGRKLAEYAGVQRETEYKRGVSTYRDEAQKAQEFFKVLDPYMPELQRHNIPPAQFVGNLAAAHYALVKGTPEQKHAMLHRLAQDYGIQLNQAGEFQPQDAYTRQLMEQLNRVNQEVGVIKNRYEQEENSRLMNEIEQHRLDSENYPFFDEVRETMAQLLEQGHASDLKTAYTKAVRLNDDVWQKQEERLLQAKSQQIAKQQQVAKAKAKAVSPKSVTPSGLVAASDKKDRRSVLMENMGNLNDRY